MLDLIRPATLADFDAAWQLYADVCEQMPSDAYGPGWTLGVYPGRDDVHGHIEAGHLHLGFLDGRLAGAFALVPHEDQEYEKVAWPSGATGNEVAVIHLLCAHPASRGRGVGRSLVEEAVRISGKLGKRAIHLDVYLGNLAASRIYLDAGFTFIGTEEIYYEDTGTMEFELYEYDFATS